jgi:RNA polymerase sigma factor (sigma-70 family)
MHGGRSTAVPDADLVHASLRGDKDAFAELIVRHWSTALSLAVRVLGSADLGSDAVQEAAIAAMIGLDQLRSADRFGAWFCGITLNVARRWLRQTRAEITVRLPDQPTAEPGPHELAELAELSGAVRAAVAQLAAGQREAIMLFYLQGLTHREVAAELGITVGAVKARLHQARNALTPPLRPFAAPSSKETVMTAPADGPAWADVFVAEIRRNETEDIARQRHVMVLAEQNGDRRLPIWIGPAEGIALALSLEATETPRPLTFQMAGRLVEASGGRVTEVRITRLTDATYYAVIMMDGQAGRQEVDARPSDAVNLALVTGAAIRADAALLDNPAADGGPEWRDFPLGSSEVARQAKELIEQRRTGRTPPSEAEDRSADM